MKYSISSLIFRAYNHTFTKPRNDQDKIKHKDFLGS
jgi:hypothetical protein